MVRRKEKKINNDKTEKRGKEESRVPDDRTRGKQRQKQSNAQGGKQQHQEMVGKPRNQEKTKPRLKEYSCHKVLKMRKKEKS